MPGTATPMAEISRQDTPFCSAARCAISATWAMDRAVSCCSVDTFIVGPAWPEESTIAAAILVPPTSTPMAYPIYSLPDARSYPIADSSGGLGASGRRGRRTRTRGSAPPVTIERVCLLLFSASLALAEQTTVPARYYKLLEEGVARVDERLAAEPGATLSSIEAQSGWKHFPSAILAAAVLYTKAHPANAHRGESKVLQLALKAGDLVEREQQGGANAAQFDHRDAYMWLEGYRLLERELGEERRERWRRALLALITELAAGVAEREDYPLYQSPFIGTSPNHYSLWSSTVYLAGRVFGNKAWEKLGAKVMHRFAAEEQSADGYWGEHSSAEIGTAHV